MEHSTDYKDRQINSLRASIVHWERLYSLVKEEPDYKILTKEGWHSSSCNCCSHYLGAFFSTNPHAYSNKCKGCPIKEYTGEPTCISTPWHEACESLCSLKYSKTQGAEKEATLWKRALHSTYKEVTFLKKVYEDLIRNDN